MSNKKQQGGHRNTNTVLPPPGSPTGRRSSENPPNQAHSVICTSAIFPNEFEVDEAHQSSVRPPTLSVGAASSSQRKSSALPGSPALSLEGGAAALTRSPRTSFAPSAAFEASSTGPPQQRGSTVAAVPSVFLSVKEEGIDPNGGGVSDGETSEALSARSARRKPVFDYKQHAVLIKQVEHNVELLKHRLFGLFGMNVFRHDEEASALRVKELEETLLQMHLTNEATLTSSSVVNLPLGGHLGSGGVGDAEPRPSLNGSQSALTTALLLEPPQQQQQQRAVLSPVSAHITGGGAPFPAGATASSLQVTPGFLDTTRLLDASFRYLLEEVALRWQSLQKRPFSLRAYHLVAEEQVRQRQEALHKMGVAEEQQKKALKEVHDLQYQLDHRGTNHSKQIELYLQENRVLRSKIYDLQQKLKISSDGDPLPSLAGHGGDPHPHSHHPPSHAQDGNHNSTGGSNAPIVDPHEKHYETLNRRLTEECAVLTHTMEQRANLIKVLQTELGAAKTHAATLKEEFRHYISEQEQLDAEMKKAFMENEAATESARLEADLATRQLSAAQAAAEKYEGLYNNVSATVDALTRARDDAFSERDALREMNAQFEAETQKAKETLVLVQAKAASDAATAAANLKTANDRIYELENDGTREKLAKALNDIKVANAKIDGLQETIKKRDSQIVEMKEEHHKEVNKLEERYGKLQEVMEAERVTNEALLVREKQRGVELAEKRVAETKAAFAEEHEEQNKHLDVVEKLLQDLTMELMLFHRQSTLLEPYLRRHFPVELRREIAKLFLSNDLRRRSFVRRSSKASLALEAADDSRNTVHTPRTKYFFDNIAMFDPKTVQERWTLASENGGGPTDTATQNTNDLDHDLQLQPPLLLKSKVTMEFLEDLLFHIRKRLDATSSASGEGGETAAVYGSLHPLDTAPTEAEDEDDEKAEGDNNVTIPSAAAATGSPADASSVPNTATKMGQDSRRILRHQQRLIMEDFRSRLNAAILRIKSLEDELHEALEGEAQLRSLPGGKKKESSSSFRGATGNNAAAAFPGSAVHATLGGGGSPSSRPGSANAFDDRSAPLMMRPRSAAEDSVHSSTTPSLNGMQDPSSSNYHETTRTSRYNRPPPPSRHALLREYPGLVHASEFLDLVESSEAIRWQLQQLVRLCAEEAEQQPGLSATSTVGGGGGADRDAERELLAAKFDAFRAIESHGTSLVHRLHHKKEDVMRRREEDLEKVLESVQAISLTHPKESQKLMRVAKRAVFDRHFSSRGLQQSPAPGPLRMRQFTMGSADGLLGHVEVGGGGAEIGGGGAGADASSLEGHLRAVIVRPMSVQSLRRATPTPQDVTVCGTAALRSLRRASATPTRSR